MSQTQIFRGVQTRITRIGGTTQFIYRGTTVVELVDGGIILRNGGWSSVTTKLRMNQAANQFGLGFVVYQEAFAWFVVTKDGTYDYSDGMRIDPLGRVEHKDGTDAEPLPDKPALINGRIT